MNNQPVTELLLSDGVCPCCDEEITVATVGVTEVELRCRCGCSLAVA